MSRPALIARGVVVAHAALDRLAAPDGEGPVVVRGAPRLARALAVHAALTHRRTLAPIPEDARPGAERAHAGRVARLLSPAEEPALAILRTSGSTGEPKLAELEHHAWAAHVEAVRVHLELGEDDRWLCVLPLDHTSGLSILVRCRRVGAAVVLDEPPPLGPGWSGWLDLILRAAGVTRLSLVPAQLGLIADHALPAPRTLRSVVVGGQALDAAVAARAVALGWPVLPSYGLTETCGMCVAGRPGELRGAGRPLAGTRLRLRAELLELETPALARRVHGARDAIGADGWLRTCDRARVEDGALFVLGRADEVIVSGGNKIDPLEVERALRSLPLVADAAVAGIDDARLGARLGALVVLRAGRSDAEARDRIAAAIAAQLPRHQRPRRIVCLPALPRLGSGKLDRRAVRERLAGDET